MSPTGQQCGRCVLSGQVPTHRPGMLNYWGRGIPHVTAEKKSTYCYITDNILAQERRVGTHFGDFISF